MAVEEAGCLHARPPIRVALPRVQDCRHRWRHVLGSSREPVFRPRFFVPPVLFGVKVHTRTRLDFLLSTGKLPDPPLLGCDECSTCFLRWNKHTLVFLLTDPFCGILSGSALPLDAIPPSTSSMPHGPRRMRPRPRRVRRIPGVSCRLDAFVSLRPATLASSGSRLTLGSNLPSGFAVSRLGSGRRGTRTDGSWRVAGVVIAWGATAVLAP